MMVAQGVAANPPRSALDPVVIRTAIAAMREYRVRSALGNIASSPGSERAAA
jgi:hypothetical protein